MLHAIRSDPTNGHAVQVGVVHGFELTRHAFKDYGQEGCAVLGDRDGRSARSKVRGLSGHGVHGALCGRLSYGSRKVGYGSYGHEKSLVGRQHVDKLLGIDVSIHIAQAGISAQDNNLRAVGVHVRGHAVIWLGAESHLEIRNK